MVEAAQAPGGSAAAPAVAVPLWGRGLWKLQCQIRPVTQHAQGALSHLPVLDFTSIFSNNNQQAAI